MKYIFILMSVFISFKATAHDFALYPEPLRAPVSLFEDEHRNMLTLGNFQGKVTILNFWATWCKPCVIEMPSLRELQKKIGTEKLAIVPLINSTETVSKVRSFYRRHKLKELGYYVDSDDMTTQSFQVTGVPVSYIFNKNGKLVASVDGPVNWMDKKNVEFIENLLK